MIVVNYNTGRLCMSTPSTRKDSLWDQRVNFVDSFQKMFLNIQILTRKVPQVPPPPPDFNDLDICFRRPKTKRHVFFLICLFFNKTNWKSFGIMRDEKPYFPDFIKKILGGEPPPTYDENNRK